MSGVQDDLVVQPDFRTGLIVLIVLAVAGAGIVAAILIGDAPVVFALDVRGLFVMSLPWDAPGPEALAGAPSGGRFRGRHGSRPYRPCLHRVTLHRP
ncbi:hypothetical protein [Actinomadura sp. B10D3]|uniref:hypothetical protein n=1 Tax=Actinomadura sp. B10D3 TaxID=3153557 RepID=UPI00325D0711